MFQCPLGLFGRALFEAEARLSKHDFIPVPQSDPLAWALRDRNHGAVPDDGGSVGAPIIEEAEHSLLGIELNVGMSSAKRMDWERARRLGMPRHFFVRAAHPRR